jgi:hypothetical protein
MARRGAPIPRSLQPISLAVTANDTVIGPAVNTSLLSMVPAVADQVTVTAPPQSIRIVARAAENDRVAPFTIVVVDGDLDSSLGQAAPAS